MKFINFPLFHPWVGGMGAALLLLSYLPGRARGAEEAQLALAHSRDARAVSGFAWRPAVGMLCAAVAPVLVAALADTCARRAVACAMPRAVARALVHSTVSALEAFSALASPWGSDAHAA